MRGFGQSVRGLASLGIRGESARNSRGTYVECQGVTDKGLVLEQPARAALRYVAPPKHNLFHPEGTHGTQYPGSYPIHIAAIYIMSEKELNLRRADIEEVGDSKVHEVDTKRDDVAATFLASIAEHPDADSLLAEPTPQEEKKLLRKIDLIIMTLLQFALMMGAVDKVSIGTAAVLGFRTDAHLVGQQYAWTSSMIYFGAITAVFPSLYLLQKLPSNRYIAFNVTMWGVLTMCLAACKSFSKIMAIRYLLGVFESIVSISQRMIILSTKARTKIFAAFGLIISMWWTRREQPFRTAVIFSTLSSVMNGILGTASVYYTGTVIKKWQLLFLLVGSITTIWSILIWFLLPSSPTNTRWLTLRQRVIATKRTQGNHTGMENKTFKLYQVIEAFKDPKSWFLFFINFALNVPNGGLVTFNSIIVASLGFTIKQTTLLGIPTGVFSWISSLIFSYIAVKTKQRALTGMASMIIPFLGVILLYTIPRSNIGGSLASLYLVYWYWGPYIVLMGASYANTGGYTKKMTVYAISYIGYCVGNIVGPQTFRANQAPKYTGGVIAMLVCYIFSSIALLGYRFYIVHLNKKKAIHLAEWKAAHAEGDTLLAELHDETDFENVHFVYEV
ncbi:MFS transporter, ACS family, allantoate permease, partial [Tremellales sp. Uapishka_1]